MLGILEVDLETLEFLLKSDVLKRVIKILNISHWINYGFDNILLVEHGAVNYIISNLYFRCGE